MTEINISKPGLQASLQKADIKELKARLQFLSHQIPADDLDTSTICTDPKDPSSSDAVEEIVRELQFENDHGSLEALLLQSTSALRSKADSLRTWFVGASMTPRGCIADSAASTDSMWVLQRQNEESCYKSLMPRNTR